MLNLNYHNIFAIYWLE